MLPQENTSPSRNLNGISTEFNRSRIVAPFTGLAKGPDSSTPCIERGLEFESEATGVTGGLATAADRGMHIHMGDVQ